MSKILVAPSMMCANQLDIKSELDVFKEFNIDLLHIDVMDGHYVPNFALGSDFCKSLVSYTKIPLDIHLMIDQVDQNLDVFCCLTGSRITFHPETSRHPVRTIQKIREWGCKPGIAIDPAITIDSIKHLIPLVDQICVMTVNPGYAGQALIPFCMKKISELRQYIEENSFQCQIEVDGNVSWENIPKMISAGADILVLGTSSIFSRTQSRQETLVKLKNMLADFDGKTAIPVTRNPT